MVEHAADLDVDAAGLIVAGDSAGGGEAAVVSLTCRERGAPMPVGQVVAAGDRVRDTTASYFGAKTDFHVPAERHNRHLAWISLRRKTSEPRHQFAQRFSAAVQSLLHGNFRKFTQALETSVVSGWPVIILYHLYAGLAGLIQFTRVGENMAGMAASVSNAYTFPALTAWIASVFSFFIPSSGGQWRFRVHDRQIRPGGRCLSRARSVGAGPRRPQWQPYVAVLVRRGVGHWFEFDFRAFFGYGLLSCRGLVRDRHPGIHICSLLTAASCPRSGVRHGTAVTRASATDAAGDTAPSTTTFEMKPSLRLVA